MLAASFFALIVPATHSRGRQKEATTGLVAGLVIMMLPDVSLG